MSTVFSLSTDLARFASLVLVQEQHGAELARNELHGLLHHLSHHHLQLCGVLKQLPGQVEEDLLS